MTESEFQEFIITVGYRYNEKSGTAFNTFEGFHSLIVFNGKEKKYSVYLNAAPLTSSDAAEISKKTEEFKSKHKNYVTKASYKKKTVHLCIKMTVDSEVDKRELKETARFIIELCKSGKAVPICKVCSRKRKTGLYVVGRELMPICDPCITRKRRQYEHRKNIFNKKEQNMAGGLAGAVFGSALGAAIYILLYQFIPMFGTGSCIIVSLSFAGFVITGQRATKKSAVICAVISFVMFAAAEYMALVANMAILIEQAGGGIALSEAIDATNSGFGDFSFTNSVLTDILIGTVVIIIVGIIYFLKRKYTRPLKISKNVL